VKKRIRYIFILMSVCIVGILAVQGYWLYNTWHIAYDQFSRSINGALAEAAGHKGFSDMKAYLRAHPAVDGNAAASAPVAGRYFRLHRMQKEGALSDTVKGRPGTASPRAAGEVQDSLNGPESPYWYFISERLTRQPYNLAGLDSAFREELDGRGIRAAFVLDTQRARRSDFRDKDFRRIWRAHTPLETRWTHVNPVGDLYVRATFATPYGYLFGKLLWILVSSLILLVLICWCFLYMLTTILKQKRWSEIKNDFISNMTHELKTPIATVSAAVEALQHFQGMEDKSKAQSYLDISQHELDRLSGLVEKVLHISVEENREMVLHREKVSLRELIGTILAGQELKAGKEVSFTFNCVPEDLTLNVDRMHFSNAINNLIDNAVKYSYQKVDIRIDAWMKGGSCLLTIKDDGIGIPGLYQPLVFDKFFRVPTGDLHKVKGFGLGLSYVKKVVQMHGGTIRLKSEPGKGTAFSILLPVQGRPGSQARDTNQLQDENR
jgi:signal transduction histidine kinase